MTANTKQPTCRDDAMTLADHAEYWWREQGRDVPPRGSAAWQAMYETWVEWAFSDLHGSG